MRIIRILIVIMFTLYMSSTAIAEGPSIENLVSMDFQDANLKTVLKVFSQQSGLNFVAGETVEDRTVTVYFENVTVGDALTHLMDANNLVYEQAPGSSIFIVKESDIPEIKTITKIYELKYAQLFSQATGGETEAVGETVGETEAGSAGGAEILSVIGGILSEEGSIVADKRSNNIIVTDIPSQFAIIEEVIARVDVPASQVMIEAEIIETKTALIEKLGINWSGTFGAYTGPVASTLAPLRGRFSKDLALGEGMTTAGNVSLSGMTATLNALFNPIDTKILARPRILVMNNEVAKIELSAKEVARQYTETLSTTISTTSDIVYEEKDTGVILEVTPQINKDGYILMHLKPDITSLIASRYENQYDTQTRSTDTTVMVKDGETVVIGGLIRTTNNHTFEKIPFLGDIPILGMAFRYKTKEDEDKELLIFITPHIKKESVYALASISEREQEKPKAVREKEIKSLLDLLGGGY